MNQLVSYKKNINSKSTSGRSAFKLEEEGKKLYKTNSYYHDIATIMEHPEFRNFYVKYLNDWFKIKLAIIFCRIYFELEKRFEKEYKTSLTPFQKIALLHRTITTKEIRKSALKYLSNDLCSGSRNRKCIEKNTGSTR